MDDDGQDLLAILEAFSARQRQQEDAENALRGWAPCTPISWDEIYTVEELESASVDLAHAEHALSLAQAFVDDDQLAVDAARKALGSDPSEPRPVAWATFTRARDLQPEAEDALLQAYWTVKRARERQANILEPSQSEIDRIRARHAAAERLGWPVQWPVHLAGRWEELGGIGPSAAAWAAAGWSPHEVLTLEHFSDSWNAEVATRVVSEVVPRRSR